MAVCAACGAVLAGRSRRARYCGSTCRSRAARARSRGEDPAGVGPLPVQVEPDPVGPVAAAALADLEAAGRAGTHLGRLALGLADRLDSGLDAGSAVAALSRELRATMADALAGSARVVDAVDEVRARRERRLRGA